MINPLQRITKKLARKSFFLSRFLYHLQRKREVSSLQQLIVVYQMGKVGSSSVVRSLKRKNIQSFNVHTFDPFFLQRGQKFFRKEFNDSGALPYTLWDQQFLRRNFVNKPVKKSIKIITLVRDPIARNISLFFQWPNMIMEQDVDGYRIRSLTFDYDRLFKAEGIEQQLEKIFMSQFKLHERPLVWFDKELYHHFKIDVYGHEFPREKGYSIYRNDKVEAMVIKLEKLSDVAGEAFKEFLGIEIFELIDANRGQKKNTSELYQNFLGSIKLPPDYLDTMYNSRFARHFYTMEELNGFRARWSRA